MALHCATSAVTPALIPNLWPQIPIFNIPTDDFTHGGWEFDLAELRFLKVRICKLVKEAHAFASRSVKDYRSRHCCKCWITVRPTRPAAGSTQARPPGDARRGAGGVSSGARQQQLCFWTLVTSQSTTAGGYEGGPMFGTWGVEEHCGCVHAWAGSTVIVCSTTNMLETRGLPRQKPCADKAHAGTSGIQY